MGKHERLTGAQRVAKRRAALRAQGLRLKQFWVPDVRNPKVRESIRRSIEIINTSREEADYLAWLDANYDELMASEPPYDWGDKEPK
jgi:hypothetical protein